MEPKDLPTEKARRKGLGYELKQMKNFVQEVTNEHFTEAKKLWV